MPRRRRQISVRDFAVGWAVKSAGSPCASRLVAEGWLIPFVVPTNLFSHVLLCIAYKRSGGCIRSVGKSSMDIRSKVERMENDMPGKIYCESVN